MQNHQCPLYVIPGAKGIGQQVFGLFQSTGAASENLGWCCLRCKTRSQPVLFWVASPAPFLPRDSAVVYYVLLCFFFSCLGSSVPSLLCPQCKKQAHKRQSFFEDLEHTLRCSCKSNYVNFVLPTRTLRVLEPACNKSVHKIIIYIYL